MRSNDIHYVSDHVASKFHTLTHTDTHAHIHLHKFEIFTSSCNSKCSNNSQSLFCFEGIKNIVVEKLKAVKYLFHHEFCIRIVALKHQKKPLKVFLLQSVFSWKSANLSKESVKESILGKSASWKFRTLLILNSHMDIRPRVFLKFWFISDIFLNFTSKFVQKHPWMTAFETSRYRIQ